MFITKPDFYPDERSPLKINHITKQLETIQFFGLTLSGFIALNGLLLISETIGIALIVIGLLGSFFTYLCTQGVIAIIILLSKIEINTRP
ncbi:hypothetical protein PCC7424_4258 [Gloeothece citriformis PCC 7424]|uniref:Uncharacterized protein n=1 Tax=Gloeothece citriformis (strain PCC 7424) TaxID=65393 RepID=B7K6S9_GLOC7|nr:hypothetical protein [Gloeothece citriformis]ACK72628.1 hypothetical protein PCC7424_4258 [Gloeothece citriformis PCC 7424]